MVATISVWLLLLSCPVMERVLLTLHVTCVVFNLERVIIKQNIQYVSITKHLDLGLPLKQQRCATIHDNTSAFLTQLP